jgi:hypothetical protein
MDSYTYEYIKCEPILGGLIWAPGVFGRVPGVFGRTPGVLPDDYDDDVY